MPGSIMAQIAIDPQTKIKGSVSGVFTGTMPTSKSEQAINLYDAAIRDAVADMERMEAERAAAQTAALQGVLDALRQRSTSPGD